MTLSNRENFTSRETSFSMRERQRNTERQRHFTAGSLLSQNKKSISHHSYSLQHLHRLKKGLFGIMIMVMMFIAFSPLSSHMKLLPSRRVLCTPYNYAPCHFMQSHIRKVHACNLPSALLAEWRDNLRAAPVTRRWNWYRNKSQYRKLTQEKKILPPLLQGFEPATFQLRVRRSNHWAIFAVHYT